MRPLRANGTQQIVLTEIKQKSFFSFCGRSVIILFLTGLLACRTAAPPLTDAEKAKLDPALLALLQDEDVVESDYVVSHRADGAKQFAVIIRSTGPEELRAAGIPVEAVVGDVITARVTKEELRKLVSLPSVRAVTKSGRDSLHR